MCYPPTVSSIAEKGEKEKEKKYIKEDDEDEDDDETYYPSQDFNNNSQVHREFRPSKKELRDADREGDS